jgi:hypothetical protein
VRLWLLESVVLCVFEIVLGEVSHSLTGPHVDLSVAFHQDIHGGQEPAVRQPASGSVPPWTAGVRGLQCCGAALACVLDESCCTLHSGCHGPLAHRPFVSRDSF